MSGFTRNVPVLGLVGGVGSGKSHVAVGLAAQRNVAVIAADPIGHEVLRRPAVKAQVRQRWGDTVFTPDGEIDRARVGQLVFGDDPASRDRRQQLEAITHPEITREVLRRIDMHQAQPHLEAIVLDAALLLEAGWREFCDHVIFVDSPLADRQRRVAASRGWSAEELARREASQWPLERKRNASDAVIQNVGPDQAVGQLVQLLAGWWREAGRSAPSAGGDLPANTPHPTLSPEMTVSRSPIHAPGGNTPHAP
jgi:dephospho-CoA kinase